MTNIRMLSLVGIYLVIFIDNLGASLIIPMLKPIVHDLAAGLISEGSESFLNGVYGMALGAFSIAMFFWCVFAGGLVRWLGQKEDAVIVPIRSGHELCISGARLGVQDPVVVCCSWPGALSLLAAFSQVVCPSHRRPLSTLPKRSSGPSILATSCSLSP